MRSKWIEYRGKKIFYQDFSSRFYDADSVKEELEQVQAEVVKHPRDSLLILSDFRDTQMTRDLLPALNAASSVTKDHVHRTAVLGVIGIKRTLADLLSRITGQQLRYFRNEAAAKEWLVE